MNITWIVKKLHLIPTPLVYGALGLLALWLIAGIWSSLARRKPARSLGPIEEIQMTLACTFEQAALLLREYNGDAARAIMEVKTGRKGLPSPVYDEDGFVILLRNQLKKETLALGRLLSEATGLPQPEAMRLLTPGGGATIARGLNEEVARAFCALLAREGEEAVAIQASQLPRPSMGGDVQSLETHTDGLRLHIRSAAGEFIPWQDLQLLCVGVLRSDAKPGSDGSVPAGRGDLLAHLYVGGSNPRRFSLEARKFNYSALGDRKRESSVTNFQMLLQSLADSAPQLGENPSLQMFLRDLRAVAFKSEEALGSEGITRLALAG